MLIGSTDVTLQCLIVRSEVPTKQLLPAKSAPQTLKLSIRLLTRLWYLCCTTRQTCSNWTRCQFCSFSCLASRLPSTTCDQGPMASGVSALQGSVRIPPCLLAASQRSPGALLSAAAAHPGPPPETPRSAAAASMVPVHTEGFLQACSKVCQCRMQPRLYEQQS